MAKKEVKQKEQKEPMRPVVLATYNGKDLHCTACKEIIKSNIIDYCIEEIDGKTEYSYIRMCKCGLVTKSYSWIGLGQLRKPPEQRVDLGEVSEALIQAKIAEMEWFNAPIKPEPKEPVVETEPGVEEAPKVRRRSSKKAEGEATEPESTGPSLKTKDNTESPEKPKRQRKKNN